MIADFTGSQREAILLGIANASSVLDIGCGDGQKTHLISQHVEQTVGVDPDSKLIKEAKNKYTNKNIAFYVACAEKLEFENACFSAVIFNESLHHVPIDKQINALKESFRVLQQNGTLIIVEPIHGSGSFAPIMGLFSDEKKQKEQAVNAIEKIINTSFTLTQKTNINIEYHCQGIDDLLQYSAMPELGTSISESTKNKTKGFLEKCPLNSNGNYILNYSATVWCLKKLLTN